MIKTLLIANAFVFIYFLNTLAFGQENTTFSFNPVRSCSDALFESRNGFKLPSSGVIRVLIVFAEYEYLNGGDPTPPTGYAGWPAHSTPSWANELTDVNTPTGIATGVMTRYYQMASSGNYTVLGDYLIAPDNGGIFKVHTDSSHSIEPDNQKLINEVNEKLGENIFTAHGLNGH